MMVNTFEIKNQVLKLAAETTATPLEAGQIKKLMRFNIEKIGKTIVRTENIKYNLIEIKELKMRFFASFSFFTLLNIISISS